MSAFRVKTGGLVIFLAISFSSTAVFAKEYYKWVDAKGSTHYTTTPPPQSAKKKGKVDTHGWSHTSTTTTNHQAPSTANQATKEAEKAAQESRPVVEIPQSSVAPTSSMREADRTVTPAATY